MASTLPMRTTIRQETFVHDCYASVNSSCAHASWPNLRALAFNFLALNGKFPGSETHKLSNDPRWGQRRGQIPVPKSSLQQFWLIAQSRNATLSNLRCNFSFQWNFCLCHSAIIAKILRLDDTIHESYFVIVFIVVNTAVWGKTNWHKN